MEFNMLVLCYECHIRGTSKLVIKRGGWVYTIKGVYMDQNNSHWPFKTNKPNFKFELILWKLETLHVKVTWSSRLRYAMFMYEIYNVSKKTDNFVRWVFSNDRRNDPFYVNSTIYTLNLTFFCKEIPVLCSRLFFGELLKQFIYKRGCSTRVLQK